MNHLFYSIITLLIALFFIILGAIAMIIQWSHHVAITVIDFMLNHTLSISVFGFLAVVIGIALVINVVQSALTRYYRIRSDKSPISLSDTLISDYLSTYWKELFPYAEVPCRILLKKHRIQIVADLPPFPIGEQKELLKRIEEDLLDLFRSVLGFRDELDLSISFQKK
jgi:hypothetical protein